MAVSKECRSGSPCSFWSIVSERFCTLPLWQTHLFDGWAAFLGVVPGFSPLPIGRHVHVALTCAPLFIFLHEEGSQQAAGRLTIGEDADDALASAHFLVDVFLPIGGSQALAIGPGQRQHGGSIVKTALQSGNRERCL